MPHDEHQPSPATPLKRGSACYDLESSCKRKLGLRNVLFTFLPPLLVSSSGLAHPARVLEGE